LQPSKEFELVGPYQPDSPPKITKDDIFPVPVEEHHSEVTWTAPIRIATGVDPKSLVVRGKMLGQICHKRHGCVPLSLRDTQFVARAEAVSRDLPIPAMAAAQMRRTPAVQATLRETNTVIAAAGAEPLVPPDTKFQTPPVDGYRAGAIHVSMQGRVEPATAAPGTTIHLIFSAVPDQGWHVYAYAAKDPSTISKPMLIAVSEPAGWQVDSVTESEKPVVKKTGLALEPEQRYHEGAVEWRVPIKIPQDTAGGEYSVRGMIGYQTCTDSRCDMPVGAYFSAQIRVGEGGAGAAALQFAPGKYASVARYLAQDAQPPAPGNGAASTIVDPPMPNTRGTIDFDLSKIRVQTTARQSTPYILIVAFLGGFLLNFMPCVLPVIGLKVMSFVHQAGERRGRVFTLNVWYSLGILSIFWLLALLASAASLNLSSTSLGWGEQFNYDGFTIPLLCVVFVMGLSFIGVWEIPIPGFVGTGRPGQLAQQEGLVGAFCKGIVTTILATPCSGPGLATALTWSANKPPHLVFMVFTVMGLGMSLPYLLIGLFPSLVRFLPKPGAWMETFKQFMGFVLMGTVVYMFTLIDTKYVIPTLAMIFALWAACWWVGRLPYTASGKAKAAAWLTSAAVATIVGWFAFAYERDRTHELPWEPFSMAALDDHVKAGRTVMVDFTARWCPTCKVLERSVLNTRPIHKLVQQNDVVAMVADWSDGDEEIGRLLEALTGSKQLPVIAIFPAGDAYRPQTLAGAYTRRELASKLSAAGPSSTSTRLASETRSR
jgi:thiol:disulfide interchange protein